MTLSAYALLFYLLFVSGVLAAYAKTLRTADHNAPIKDRDAWKADANRLAFCLERIELEGIEAEDSSTRELKRRVLAAHDRLVSDEVARSLEQIR